MQVQTSIGNLNISIFFPADLFQISNSLVRFKAHSEYPDYIFEIQQKKSFTIPENVAFRRDHFFIEKSSLDFCLGNEFFSLEINFLQKKSLLTIDSGFNDKKTLVFNAFKWFISLITIDNGGIPLHCSNVFRNNESLLFSGKSGAGKSTILNILCKDSKLWQRGSDELNLIFLQDSTAIAYPTPYLSFDADIRFCGAQLRHLFFIIQSPSNSIKNLGSKEKYWNIIKNIYTIPSNDYFAEKMYNNIQNISNVVNCSNLLFVNNQSVRTFIEDWMD